MFCAETDSGQQRIQTAVLKTSDRGLLLCEVPKGKRKTYSRGLKKHRGKSESEETEVGILEGKQY